MKAVVVDPNAPGHLTVGELAAPSPGPSEALVKVADVSLNLGEIRRAQTAEAGERIGWDLAGTVEEAAADGTGPAKGARVVGLMRTGAWAELAAVPTDTLAQIPDSVTFVQAATLPVAGLTALHTIERGGGLLMRNVLVTGASGGVGHFCCQLARQSGARVVGQIRRDRYKDIVAGAGADEVIVSENASEAAGSGPYRLIAEAVGGQVLANVLGMLSEDGICVSYGASAGSEITFDIWSLIGAGRASLYGLVMRDQLVREPGSEGLARLAAMVGAGRLKPHISAIESWAKVGEMVSEFLERKFAGKVVLHIA